MARISTGSPWPESGTLGFGKVSEMGKRASLILEHDPTRYIYKPNIETFYGFKKILLKTPMAKTLKSSVSSTTRMMSDFYSIVTPGRSLSLWPFMSTGGLSSLTDKIPTLDDPIKGFEPEEVTKTDYGLDLRKEHKERTMLQDIEEQATELLPDLTDKFKRPKPEPTDPITILKPIHDPIEDIWVEPGYKQKEEPVITQGQSEDQKSILIPPSFKEPIQEPKTERPIPKELWYPSISTRKQPRPKPLPKTQRKLLYTKKKRGDDLFGFESKKYDILSPKQVRELGLKKSGKMPKDMLLKRKKGKLDLL